MHLPAIVLANGYYQSPNGKTAHGLVRGSDRFSIQAVVDPACAGGDAGEVLDGCRRNIPLVADIATAIRISPQSVSHCIIGIATHGGHFIPQLRTLILDAIGAGLSIVNGLHDCCCDAPDIAQAAARAGVELIDIRKPKAQSQLHIWEGRIHDVRAPRLAVLGTDCALGKRTTARMLVQALGKTGVHAEMIYTGQTGWMQGSQYGFILDATPNDYVSGELEAAIVRCDEECRPQLIVLEGQSALRNPSGPCGAEFLLSAAARSVVLQHSAGRNYFEGFEDLGLAIPSLGSELELIGLYGSRVLAITLNEDQPEARMRASKLELSRRHGIPVLRPLKDSLEPLLEAIGDLDLPDRSTAA